MRSIQKTVALETVALAVVSTMLAGCDNSTSDPVAPIAAPTANTAATIVATDVVRPRLNVSAWRNRSTTIPLALLTPTAAGNIGTGSALLITIPNEGTFGCTANFAWESGGTRYLGAAGHCFIPADRASTHGPGADYDASGVTVRVCVSGCTGNFNTNEITGTWVNLGAVAYARQTLDGVDVGNDFGVVAIPSEVDNLVRLTMPVWGGPTGVETLELGDFACHYGHGLVFGEVFVTKARVGVGGGSDHSAWMGDFAAGPGDSGSGIVGCVPTLLSFRGRGAIGVLTHLGVGLDETTGEHGFVFGTTIARAIEMAQEAGLGLSLILP